MNLHTALAVLFLAVAPIAQAQSPSAIITGTITDQSGAVIPSATVSLMTTSRVAHQTKTDYQGHFEIAVIPGSYTLKISAHGFAVSQKSVQLTPTPVAENITLGLSQGGCGVCVEPLPYIEPLNAVLTATLPLNPMPPFKFHPRRSIHL
jgi:Carboxypeptidase regulatory-like domain